MKTESINFKDYKKIILVGSGGSGKSYMSTKLSEILGYPLIHLDNEFWQPNWVKTLKEVWIEKQKQFISGETWIIDGNYNSTLEIRFAAADLVIFLDMNRFVCIYSAFKRLGKKRDDLPDYLEEKFNEEFINFCKWIWSFPHKGKKAILNLHKKYSDIAFLTIKSRRSMKKLLAGNYEAKTKT